MGFSETHTERRQARRGHRLIFSRICIGCLDVFIFCTILLHKTCSGWGGSPCFDRSGPPHPACSVADRSFTPHPLPKPIAPCSTTSERNSGSTMSFRLKAACEDRSSLRSALSLRRSKGVRKGETESRAGSFYLSGPCFLLNQKSVTCLSDRGGVMVLGSGPRFVQSIHLSEAHSCSSETLSTAYRSFNTVQINTLTMTRVCERMKHESTRAH